MKRINIELVCKALGDPNRLRIIEILSDGEKCGCELLEAFNITQPTLSHHMKVLCDCGLVTARKEGNWSHYSLCRETLKAFREYIDALQCCNEGGAGCR